MTCIINPLLSFPSSFIGNLKSIFVDVTTSFEVVTITLGIYLKMLLYSTFFWRNIREEPIKVDKVFSTVYCGHMHG